jgi:hypothetical protein
MNSAGFPHSDISGSKLAYSSPKLFAVNHVLHRQLVPRHPPCALSSFLIFVMITLSHFYIILSKDHMVEDNGFEPMTSALQGRRSPS